VFRADKGAGQKSTFQPLIKRGKRERLHERRLTVQRRGRRFLSVSTEYEIQNKNRNRNNECGEKYKPRNISRCERPDTERQKSGHERHNRE
jgi:hypothetical protein